MEENKQKLSRRRFLHLSAVAAASTLVAACGPQGPQTVATQAPAGGDAASAAATATPLPAPTAVPTLEPQPTVAAVSASAAKESPKLAALVAEGKLPPVAERLPENPYVVPHKWVKVGKYGGVLQTSNSWGGEGQSQMIQESMYGHSPLRWLNDGLSIGPGLAEKWESNEETTEWTFYFRKGLKWSDGHPWTVDDILYWWEDMARNPDYPEEQANIPDEARSGTGTLATFEKVDDYTLRMIFDAPAPLTADRVAMWVNAGIGPRWMAPKHYLSQFHPKYNPAVTDYAEHTLKMNMRTNPDVPVMTGWKLAVYEEGVRSIFERNPYYWVVDAEGNQLPYIDSIVVTAYQDKEVEKLNVFSGKIDWGWMSMLSLNDVQTFNQSKDQSKMELYFWDSGSGSGQTVFFNYDFAEEKMRNLIREPKFRKALSHAVDRADIRKRFYFDTGEPTTATFSPKAIEYSINDTGKEIYIAWRDSAVSYDPEKAKALLDEIGVKEGPDGKRTFPDGSPLKITLDYSAEAGRDVVAINEAIISTWQAIGIDAVLNPVPSSGRTDKWASGQLLTNADWGIGDGPNHLVYPQWLVPLERERWAPLHGVYYSLRGTEKENAEQDVDPWERTPPRIKAEEGSVIDQLWKLYDQSKVEPDPMKRHELVWEMIKLHIEHGPFVQGTVANFKRPVPVSVDLRNVPKAEDLTLGGFTDPWIHPTPAVYDPESWYFENPEEHGG